MSDPPSFDLSPNIFKRLSEAMELGSVFESEGCERVEELEAEQTRIFQMNLIKERSWNLCRLEERLEEERNFIKDYQIQLTGAELKNTALKARNKSLKEFLEKLNEELKAVQSQQTVQSQQPLPYESQFNLKLVIESFSEIKSVFYQHEGTLQVLRNSLCENNSKINTLYELIETVQKNNTQNSRANGTCKLTHATSNLLSHEESTLLRFANKTSTQLSVSQGKFCDKIFSLSYIFTLKI